MILVGVTNAIRISWYTRVDVTCLLQIVETMLY